jgi:hypothetical protein
VSLEADRTLLSVAPAPSRFIEPGVEFADKTRPGRVVRITEPNESLWNYEVVAYPSKPHQVGTTGRIRTEQLRTRFRKLTTTKETA